MLPTFFSGHFLYGQSLSELLRRPLFYYALFLFAFLYLENLGKQFLLRLILILIVMSVVSSLIAIIASYNFHFSSKYLVRSIFVAERYGHIRVCTNFTPWIVFSSFVCIVALTLNRKSRAHSLGLAFALLINLYYLFFVNMGRTIILIFIIIVFIYSFIYLTLHQRIILLLVFVCLVTSLQIKLINGPLDIIKKSIDLMTIESSSNQKNNVNVRVGGVLFFANEFKKTNYIGSGMLSSVRSSNAYIVTQMKRERFNPADIGFFSVLFRFGFPAVILSLILLLRLFKDLKIIIKNGEQEFKVIAISIQLYLMYNLLSFKHLIFWRNSSVEWALLMFFVWRLRHLVEDNDVSYGLSGTET
jgi:hypothetical protein